MFVEYLTEAELEAVREQMRAANALARKIIRERGDITLHPRIAALQQRTSPLKPLA